MAKPIDSLKVRIVWKMPKSRWKLVTIYTLAKVLPLTWWFGTIERLGLIAIDVEPIE